MLAVLLAATTVGCSKKQIAKTAVDIVKQEAIKQAKDLVAAEVVSTLRGDAREVEKTLRALPGGIGGSAARDVDSIADVADELSAEEDEDLDFVAEAKREGLVALLPSGLDEKSGALRSAVQGQLLVYGYARVKERARSMLPAQCQEFDPDTSYDYVELARILEKCSEIGTAAVQKLARVAVGVSKALDRVRGELRTAGDVLRTLKESDSGAVGELASAGLSLTNKVRALLGDEVDAADSAAPTEKKPADSKSEIGGAVGVGARYALTYWRDYSDLALGRGGAPNAALEGQVYTSASIQKRVDFTLSNADHWAVNAMLADSGDELQPELRQALASLAIKNIGVTVEYGRFVSVAGGQVAIQQGGATTKSFDRTEGARLFSGRAYYIPTYSGVLLGAFYNYQEVPTLYVLQNPLELGVDSKMEYQSFGFFNSIDWFLGGMTHGGEKTSEPLFGFRKTTEESSYVVLGGATTELYFGISAGKSSSDQAARRGASVGGPGFYLNSRIGYGVGLVPKKSGFGFFLGYDLLIFSPSLFASKPELEDIDGDLRAQGTPTSKEITSSGFMHGPTGRLMYRF